MGRERQRYSATVRQQGLPGRSSALPLCRSNPLSDARGLTLVELSVVMVIMGVLLVALGFSFVGWRDRYRAEGEIRKLHMDMMAARARALQTKTAYFMNMPAGTTQYGIFEDTNNDGAWNVTADTLITSTTMQYDVTAASTRHFTFSRKGMAGWTGPGIIALDTTDFGEGADYDCIAVGTTRINAGKWNTATSVCDER